MGMSGKVFLIVTIRHGQTCTRLVVSLLVHVCPLSLLLVMCVGGVRGKGRCVLFDVLVFGAQKDVVVPIRGSVSYQIDRLKSGFETM